MRKLGLTVLLAGFLFLVACSGASVQGMWEDSTGTPVEITEDKMILGDADSMSFELDLEHIDGDVYEMGLLGETEEIKLTVDGDELTMEHVATGDTETLTKAE